MLDAKGSTKHLVRSQCILDTLLLTQLNDWLILRYDLRGKEVLCT